MMRVVILVVVLALSGCAKRDAVLVPVCPDGMECTCEVLPPPPPIGPVESICWITSDGFELCIECNENNPYCPEWDGD